MSKTKSKYIDTRAIYQISITQIAEDWGVEIYPKGNGRYSLYCPNPKHHDRHLGNCFITENGIKNCFHCFACGAGGGPIQLVMYLDQCDYETAKMKIAQKYNLIKFKYIDTKNLPPRWKGLSYKEYAELGLHNSYNKIPIGQDDKGNTVYRYERYTLQQFAKDNPEAHDEMLIGKFFERLSGIILFLSYLSEEKIPGLTLDKEWENTCSHYIQHLKYLLKKGLMNKYKFYQLFSNTRETEETPFAKCI